MWYFYFLFIGTSLLFSIVAVPNYFPTNSIGGFPLLHTPSPALVTLCFSDDDHSVQCEVIHHCSFDLHFSNNYDVQHIFMCFLVIWICFYYCLTLERFQAGSNLLHLSSDTVSFSFSSDSCLCSKPLTLHLKGVFACPSWGCLPMINEMDTWEPKEAVFLADTQQTTW